LFGLVWISCSTCFTKGEIVDLRKRFLAATPDKQRPYVPMEVLVQMDILQYNPFNRRIVQCFSGGFKQAQPTNQPINQSINQFPCTIAQSLHECNRIAHFLRLKLFFFT
jgi:hypothetical protein